MRSEGQGGGPESIDYPVLDLDADPFLVEDERPPFVALSSGRTVRGGADGLVRMATVLDRHRRLIMASVAGLCVGAVSLAYAAQTAQGPSATESATEAAIAGQAGRSPLADAVDGISDDESDPDGPSAVAGGEGSESPTTTTTVTTSTSTSTSTSSPTASPETTAPPPTTATTVETSEPTAPETTATSAAPTSVETTPPAPPTTPEPTVPETTTPPTTSLGPNLVVHGGFEATSIADGGYDIVGLPPWSSTAGALEVWATGHQGVESAGGRRHAELNVSDAATYSQSLDTTAGATYRWSFRHRGRDDVDTVEVLVDGTVVATLSTGTAWTRYEGTFEASGSTTVFALRAVDRGGLGNLIDLVAVRQIIR